MEKRLQKEGSQRFNPMRRNRLLSWLSFFFLLIWEACAPKPRSSLLLKDFPQPPPLIEEIIAQEGQVDYFLLHDEGYAWRLIFLCPNKVYNLVEDSQDKLVLVSSHSVLGTEVEEKIPLSDRIKAWSCWEQRVREEQSRLAEIKKILAEERKRIEEEITALAAEKERIEREIEERKKIAGQRQQIAAERRAAEAEAQAKLEEEQRKKIEKIEEEKKVKYYRAREKEREEVKEKETSPQPKVTETGIFLVMKDSAVQEMPKRSSRVLGKVKKYDLFEVLNTVRDNFGNQWHQIFLNERTGSKKIKRIGWTPEERSFWIKHKLLAWVYPGEISKIQTTKPLKLPVEEIHYTGKKTSLPDKPHLFEVTYEVSIDYTEKIYGWIEDQNGIRRADKNIEEMMELMKKLAATLWPLRIQHDILRGYIRVGFTPDQVILSWGEPDHINKTRTFMGVHEQWVYGAKPFPRAYVYFENGLVKSWEFLKR